MLMYVYMTRLKLDEAYNRMWLVAVFVNEHAWFGMSLGSFIIKQLPFLETKKARVTQR